jgi:hypothetical protein
MDGHTLRDAMGRAADGAGDVGAVAVAVVGVSAAGDGVEAVAHAAAELLVVEQHAGIDDVGVHVRCRGVVGVARIQRKVALIGAIESPGRAGLRGAGRDHTVFFDVGDAAVGEQRSQRLVVGLGHEAAQHGAVAAFDAQPMLTGHRRGHLGHTRAAGVGSLGAEGRGFILQDHAVLALHRTLGEAQFGLAGRGAEAGLAEGRRGQGEQGGSGEGMTAERASLA